MKKFLFCILFLAALLPVTAEAGELTVRGCWVSTVYNLDYPSAAGLSAGQLAAEADAIVARAKKLGMNTLFLQVRPCADALYPSKIYPYSVWLSGTQGAAPDGGFDPLAYFITACHHNGIRLHAWINPYRVTRTPAAAPEDALTQLCQSHPARLMKDSLLFSGGCLYLDPGRPEGRALILDGVRELLENYELDGIHLDDYFYPPDLFDDSATVAAFGSAYDTADDFRRASVNALISDIHDLTQSLRPRAEFGVSPSGIWANASQIAGGSNTVGGSSYFGSYADSRKWVREGLVDYILPQLYWSVGNNEGEFKTLLDWWCETVRGTNVRLYAGLAAYRTQEAAAGDVWYGSDEIERQIEALQASGEASGAVLFRYGSIGEALSDAVGTQFRAQRDKYRLPRSEVNVGLALSAPRFTQYIASGSDVQVVCTAAPGSFVQTFCRGVRSALCAQADGSYRGVLTPGAPRENESARSSVPLCIAERGGFLWVKLYGHPITTVTCGDPVTLTDVSGTDKKGSHGVLFETGAPCAVSLETAGDTLRVALSPVRVSALFEDSFFSEIDMQNKNGVCIYTFTLPKSTDSYTYDIEWRESRIAVVIVPRKD